MTSFITRTAKSATGKTALTLLGVLAALSVGVFAYAKAAKPDFSISASPAKRSVQVGKATSYTVKLKRLHKFNGAVTLGVSGLPRGAKASWSAGKARAKANVIKKNVGSATLTILTGQTTPAGTTKPTITAKSGRLKHTKKLQLVVVAVQGGGTGGNGGPVGGTTDPPAQTTTFSIAATPSSRSIPKSDTASYDIAIDRSGGYTGPVTLTVTGLPSGATVPATSASNNSASLPVDTTNSTPVGSYPLVVTGTGTNGVTSSSNITLVVGQNLPFTISGNLTTPLRPGLSAPLDLTLANPNSFPIRVDALTVADPPAISGSFPGCVAADNFKALQIASTALPITLAGNETKTLTAAGVTDSDKPHVLMLNTTEDQEPCKGASLSLTYSGHAIK